jgi:hypothetical protein
MKKLLAAILAALFCATQAFADAPSIPPSYVAIPPNIATAGPATVRQVTPRTAIPNAVSGSNTQGGGRSWQIGYVPISAIKVCYANWYVNSTVSGVETGAGGVATVRMTVEYPRGTFTVLTWGGSGSGSVADKATGCTDLTNLGFTIPANTWFRINEDANYASGGHVVFSNWSNVCDRAGVGDEYNGGASGYGHTQDDTVLGAGAANCWHPAAVMALSDRAVVGIVGDSIPAGVNDMTSDPSGARGLGRAFALQMPQINNSVPGDRANWYVTTANSALRTSLLATAGVTVIVNELAVNDFFAGNRTADQVLGDLITISTNIRSALPGIPIFHTTTTPETTSTDGWVTTANQTTVGVANNNSRMAKNDFQRGVTSYTATCSATNSSTALTGCSGLTTTTVGTGMYASGTGFPASDALTAVNQYAGTATLTSNFTGTTGSVSTTFAWPTFTTTWANWQAASNGLIDIARIGECAPNQTNVLVANGGVWCVGYVGQTDGTHPTTFFWLQVEQLMMNFSFMRKADAAPANDNARTMNLAA